MREISRSTARLSEVEVSQLPEVAALATELTTLFNGLEISQQRYAARTLMDKSTVSRYLRGRRVATQDFIDRMLTEIERHRRTSVTPEARIRLRHLRLAALRVSDFQAYELENLRDQVDRSHREIKNLRRQQEALELLLDQREAAEEESKRQLEDLRSDWTEDRIQSESTLQIMLGRQQRIEEGQEELQKEISRLREQIDEINKLKEAAEERCGDLEKKLMEAEVALSERLHDAAEASFALTLEEIQEEIESAHDEQRFHDAARLLSLAAAHFTESDTSQLALWLLRDERELDAQRLVDDALRFNSIDFIDKLVRYFIEQPLISGEEAQYAWIRILASRLSTSKSRAELQELYTRWNSRQRTHRILRISLVDWAVRANIKDAFAMLKTFRENDDSVISIRFLHKFGARHPRDVLDLASACLIDDMRHEASLLVFTWMSRTHSNNRDLSSSLRRYTQRISRSTEVDALIDELWASLYIT
ncbi:hypothetical protein AB0D24_03895 [Streptomyces javensis]|uniref:hypothetical protein n=1 Tax=Streptomyces javensis TaxID=114698 RepID=UPI0033F7ED5C